MFDQEQIDSMVADLEQRIPVWYAEHSAEAFDALLGCSLRYIAYGASEAARAHCLRRTGHMYPGSGQALWEAYFGDA
jgi:hypothetical protein